MIPLNAWLDFIKFHGFGNYLGTLYQTQKIIGLFCSFKLFQYIIYNTWSVTDFVLLFEFLKVIKIVFSCNLE